MTDLPAFYDEPRPADFSMRLGRKVRPLGLQQRANRRGHRLAALAAAIAVPAVAAPHDWHAINTISARQAQPDPVIPMEFEKPGFSFPGSAFYYLHDTPRSGLAQRKAAAPLPEISGADDAISRINNVDASLVDASPFAAIGKSGPAARAFQSRGTGLDKARALQCLASAVYYEAASETLSGQRAVAQVVLNRVAHAGFPTSVCGVVYQGSNRKTGCQFSFTCDGSLVRRPSQARRASAGWKRAQMVARDALSGETYRPVGLATHYHTIWINPYWAPSLDPVGTIGAHRFYHFRGAAGKAGAFRAAYSGHEPFAAPLARKNSDLANAPSSPAALAGRFKDTSGNKGATAPSIDISGRSSGQEAIRRSPSPNYAASVAQRGTDLVFRAQNLPRASSIRPEYANSGQWITQPK